MIVSIFFWYFGLSFWPTVSLVVIFEARRWNDGRVLVVVVVGDGCRRSEVVVVLVNAVVVDRR